MKKIFWIKKKVTYWAHGSNSYTSLWYHKNGFMKCHFTCVAGCKSDHIYAGTRDITIE